MLLALGRNAAVAKSTPPEQVLLHTDSIRAAQGSNTIHIPRLEEETRIVNANNQTAKSSRQIICSNYPDFCTGEYINPLNTPGIDPASFKDFQ